MSGTASNLESRLHTAAKEGRLKDVKDVIEKEPSLLNARNEEGYTSLRLAAENGHLNIVEYLTGKDASLVNARDELNSAPLSEKREVYRIPVENKVKVEAMGHNLWTRLHVAIWSEKSEMINSLLENEADVNAPDLDGNTPCHLAAIKGQIESLKVLLPRMRRNSCNGHNQTVYDLIREKHANDEDFKKHSEFLQASERSKGPPVPLERLPKVLKLNSVPSSFENHDISLEKLTTPEEAQGILQELGGRKSKYKEEYLETLLERFAHPRIDLIRFRVESFVEYLLKEAAKIDNRFAGTLELVGSSGDGTKVGNPDEFDFLLLIEGLGNLETEFDVNGKVYVRLTDHDALDRWEDFLTKNNILSLWRIKEHFQNLMWETSSILESLKKFDFSFNKVTWPDITTDSTISQSTPIVPLVRNMKVGCTLRLHCQITRLTIDVDLVPTIKIQGWPRHPKILPYEELRKVVPASIKDEEISFCIISSNGAKPSFPTTEKMILSHCEESLLNSLRILKILIHLVNQAWDEVCDDFDCYEVKTGFLRYLASRKNIDEDTLLPTIRKILSSCKTSRKNATFFIAGETKQSPIKKFVDIVEKLINTQTRLFRFTAEGLC